MRSRGAREGANSTVVSAHVTPRVPPMQPLAWDFCGNLHTPEQVKCPLCCALWGVCNGFLGGVFAMCACSVSLLVVWCVHEV